MKALLRDSSISESSARTHPAVNDSLKGLPEIENPLVTGIKKLPPRNTSWPTPDTESGWASTYDHSPWLKSLNSEDAWSFCWSPEPSSRPAHFYRPDFDAQSWQRLRVPACWQMHGYGVPIYSNHCYPFQPDPPRVMSEPPPHYTAYTQRNPVGSYRRWFEVPDDWIEGSGERVLLHFAGVSAAMYVWVNGHLVGYSQDSRSPAEFDITEYLLTPDVGSNLLAVEVYSYCAGSYLEDQDMWRLSGIFRDVFLYRTPAVTVWDFHLEVALADDYEEASIALHFNLRRLGQSMAALLIRVCLHDEEGNEPWGAPVIAEKIKADEGVSKKVTLQNPKLWSHEIPYLYSALVELVDEESGIVIEARRMDVGFRRIEVLGQQLAINGRPIKVKGVNRHESNPEAGYVVSAADMERDIHLIKQANFNFVRGSHYPNDPRWYGLCNRHGLLVMDEANVESHGLSYHKCVLPGDDLLWEPMTVERLRRMVVRDRGQPCVVMWSLGNEAGYGKVFLRMREEAHRLDPERRLIQYADMNLAGDIDSQTYPTTEWLLDHLAGKAVRKGEHGELGSPEQHGIYPSGKPFIANEYAHAHGNALGNFKDYWDIFYAHPELWGGFIWEWADQTLLKKDEAGRLFHAYGGDFGDQPNDGRFCCKGLVSAERHPRPHYWEAKKVLQSISFRSSSDDLQQGRVQIRNHYSFLPLSTFSGEWVIEKNGYAVADGGLVGLEALPGESVWATLDISPGVIDDPMAEYFLTMVFRLREGASWASAGHCVAWEQIPLHLPSYCGDGRWAPALLRFDTWEPVKQDVLLCAAGAEVLVDAATGQMSSIKLQGKEYLRGPIRPCFWRVPTDSDIGWEVPEIMGAWKMAANRMTVHAFERGEAAGAESVRVRFLFEDPALAGASIALVYSLSHDGILRIFGELRLGEGTPELPRFGLVLPLVSRFSHAKWYGRGPQENYCDRLSGARVGIHELSVANWQTPYVRPQENGHRTGIRWLELYPEQGEDRLLHLKAAALPLLGVSVWTCTDENMENATHDAFLNKEDALTVHVDGWMMGVGGDTSWGSPVHEAYRSKIPGTYSFEFELSAGAGAG
ncbi:DUF4981 domain-containing protein [Ruficoccus amylovorans]|uniref:beta-galactosidase n=1 Tax=Ruficoccus amylovorans TaxID=1804625 RepID=A0A842H8G6_9BACT|nr:glycoside hydrolase family 2 TIM barrel-domain containing protein [Ruficoccus amylovorans]MBC2592823.1 DUF4981 domain-containing protein [Ruficoccus amylovorans]